MQSRRIARSFLGKIRLRVVILLAIVLLVLIAVLLITRQQRLSITEPDYIRVYLGENLAGRLDRTWLDGLSGKELSLEDGTTVSCVELKDALASMDASMTVYETLEITGASDTLLLTGEDILPDDSAYLLYRMEGKALTPAQGGPFRVMVGRQDGTFEHILNVRSIKVRFIEE